MDLQDPILVDPTSISPGLYNYLKSQAKISQSQQEYGLMSNGVYHHCVITGGQINCYKQNTCYAVKNKVFHKLESFDPKSVTRALDVHELNLEVSEIEREMQSTVIQPFALNEQRSLGLPVDTEGRLTRRMFRLVKSEVFEKLHDFSLKLTMNPFEHILNHPPHIPTVVRPLSRLKIMTGYYPVA